MPKIEVLSSENGPNLLMIDGKTSLALCRCGRSLHAPLCDGSHRTAGYRAARITTTLEA